MPVGMKTALATAGLIKGGSQLSKWMGKKAGSGFLTGAGGFGKGATKASGGLGMAGYTLMMAPAAVTLGAAMRVGVGAIKGTYRGSMAAGKAIGGAQVRSWSKLKRPDGKTSRTRLAGLAAGGALWGAAYTANRSSGGFVRDRRERDPVNAMHLNQSIHRGRS